MKVTLESGEQLEATSGHPFYIQGKGWNAAAGLKVGDALLLHNGTTLVVKTVDSRVGWERVYNFSVAGNANYFVEFGSEYGNFEVRDSILFGPSGKATRLESTFKIMPDGSRSFITTIPFR